MLFLFLRHWRYRSLIPGMSMCTTVLERIELFKFINSKNFKINVNKTITFMCYHYNKLFNSIHFILVLENTTDTNVNSNQWSQTLNNLTHIDLKQIIALTSDYVGIFNKIFFSRYKRLMYHGANTHNPNHHFFFIFIQ
jgi:hypothetical protein